MSVGRTGRRDKDKKEGKSIKVAERCRSGE